MFSRTAFAGLLCVIAMHARTQESGPRNLFWTGQAGVASGLVYRGITLDQGALVPSLNLAVEHTSGFYLHGWLTRVDMPQPAYYPSADTMWQTLLATGYKWRVSPAWTMTIAHNWFRYSDELPDRRPDYREWLFTVDYNNLLVLDYAHTEELWGLDHQQDALSLGFHWPLTRRLIGGATLGLIEQTGVYQDRYHYLRLNLGYLLAGDWSVQLQYHDSFGVADVYGDNAARREWVAQLNWHW